LAGIASEVEFILTDLREKPEYIEIPEDVWEVIQHEAISCIGDSRAYYAGMYVLPDNSDLRVKTKEFIEAKLQNEEV